jgi:hypothetical protein
MVYVLVVLISGYWMTISDSDGNPKTFRSVLGCEAAYTAALILESDVERVEDHRCVEKNLEKL